MKNTIASHYLVVLPALALAAVLYIGIAPAYAEDDAAENSDVKAITITINVDAGLTPKSLLYVVDSAFERMGIWLAGSAEEKVEKLLGYADEKAQEVEKTAKDDPEAAEKAAERYEKYIAEAVERAEGATTESAAGEAIKDNEITQLLMENIQKTVTTQMSAVSETVQGYIKEQAEEQLEKAKDAAVDAAKQKAIEQIEEIEL